MKTFHDYIDSDLLIWLHENNFKFKQAEIKTGKGTLNILFNNKVCLKIYDRLGHGFGININVADNYDESIYENDSFSLQWTFEYFNIKQTASFNTRTQNQYEQNLPKLIADIKNIIPIINQMSVSQWDSMKKWIEIETRKQFI